MSGLLELDGVRCVQGGFVLSADIAVPSEGVTAVFGPSGAGKSTLLKVVAGLARLDAGRVVLDGEVLESVGEARARIPAHRREIGMVFQDARLFPHLSVRGNLDFAMRRRPAGRAALCIEEVAQRLEFAHLLDRPVGKLSGGEQGRVALGRAMIAAPKLLLLDEPFAALDGRLRRAFVTMLGELARASGLPMVVVTHIIDDAVELADHVVAMANGGVVAAGRAGEVAGSADFAGLLDARDAGVRLDSGVLSGEDGVRGRGVWVRADNVLVAVEAPRGLSARNVWAGKVEAVQIEPSGARMVRMMTDVGPVVSRVTEAAVQDLKLQAGQPAWAVVKTHAV